MRYCFAALLCLVFLKANAQDEPAAPQKKYDLVPRVQMQMPLEPEEGDCYNYNFNNGVKFQEKGLYEDALKWFEEALNCPEVSKNAQFKRSVLTRIAGCKEKLEPRSASRINRPVLQRTVIDIGKKGRYRPSRSFLEMDEPDCYQQTKSEGDRAFARGFWEDAASLYRAAKSCRDADQNNRRFMNTRIERCRLEAEEELLKKEREAVRQARHAIASNRANDARELLRKGRRSLSFRLADFANAFIAPEGNGNSDCLQAMYNAWYFNPNDYESDEIAGTSGVPLCYQLAENLDDDAQVHFAGAGDKELLYVFSPSLHILFSWNLSDFSTGRSTPVDASYRSFDVSPDGNTLVFTGDNRITLWRSNDEYYSISVGKTPIYSFDPSGRFFHYYDDVFQQIKTARVNEIFTFGKGYVQTRANSLRTRVVGVGDKLKAFEFHGDSLWLGYSDSIAVISRPAPGASWRVVARWKMNETPLSFGGAEKIKLHIDPKQRLAYYFDEWQTILYYLDAENNAEVYPFFTFQGRALGLSEKHEMITLLEEDLVEKSSLIQWVSTADSKTKYYATTNWRFTEYMQPGSFSNSGNWYAVVDPENALKVWLLDESNNALVHHFQDAVSLNISPDGQWLIAATSDSIQVCNADEPAKVLFQTPRSEGSVAEMIAGNHWLLFNHQVDSVILWDWLSGEQWVYQAPSGDMQNIIAAIDEDNDRLALGLDNDSIIVYSLSDRTILNTRRFEGRIEQIAFVPGSDKLLLIQYLQGKKLSGRQAIPRIWDFLQETESPNIVRLQEDRIQAVEISKNGDWAAFSNEYSISVYQLNNLIDEQVKIRPYEGKRVETMAFHPNGLSLAVAYDGGYLVFWDIKTGRIRFELPPVLSEEEMEITRIRFANSGLSIRICTRSGRVIEYLLDPASIRSAAQDENKQLIAFTPEQIRDLDLDHAMDYPGNFERLAASKDLPLIRAFFDFYQLQEKGSNNILSVSEYCARAYDLYAQLDPSTREALRPGLLAMYEDFSWKLLLRSLYDSAEDLVDHIEQEFPESQELRIVKGHTNLLKGNVRSAAGEYIDWLSGLVESRRAFLADLEELKFRFLQLDEYGLLDVPQQECICSLFDELLSLEDLCNGVAKVPPPANAQKTLELQLFRRIWKAENSVRNIEKVQSLQAAVEESRALRDQKFWYKQLLIRLAYAYSELSDFESPSVSAKIYLDQALDLLTKEVAFEGYETELQTTLARLYRKRANFLYLAGRYDEADEDYDLALGNYEQAMTAMNEEKRERFQNELEGPIYQYKGHLALLNQDLDKAEFHFEKANTLIKEGINASAYGHLWLLRGDTAKAMQEFRGGIYEEEHLAIALYFMDLLQEASPIKRKSLLNFKRQLTAEIFKQKPEMDTSALLYFYAINKRSLLAARFEWEQVLSWSDSVLYAAEQMMNPIDAPLIWRSRWLDAHINKSYYLLLADHGNRESLEESVRYSEQALRYAVDFFPNYGNINYLRTNYAHALFLLGEKERAAEQYKDFIEGAGVLYDPWELLEKDFRDLASEGARFPDLPELIKLIDPGRNYEPKEWLQMGVDNPPFR